MGYKTLPITPDIDNIAYGDTTHIPLLGASVERDNRDKIKSKKRLE
jgi:hypothetical protein